MPKYRDTKKYTGSRASQATKIIVVVLLVVATVLIALRLYLPHYIQDYANRTLDKNPDYDGHVGAVSLQILRGAYQIENIELRRAEAPESEAPLFAAQAFDIRMEWRALFKGKLVVELVLDRPEVNLRIDQIEKQTDDVDVIWQEQVRELFPFELNRFTIREGTLHFLDPTTTPPLDIRITSMNLEATNLTNVEGENDPLPSTVIARALVEDQAPLNLDMRVNALALTPTFTLKAALDTLRLNLLNDYFEQFAKLKVEEGKLTIVTEIAVAENRFQGYVTPAIENLNVTPREDPGILERIWGAVASGLTRILENPEEEQVATRIPFRGSIENPEVGVWALVINLLQNAFIQAIQPEFEGIIGLQEVIQLQRGKPETIEP